MSKSFIRSMTAALVVAAGVFQASPAHAQAPPKLQLSQSLAKTINAANAAVNTKRWPEVIAKAQEILATPNHKPDDTYYAYNLLRQAYNAQGNEPEERKSILGMVDSGFPSGAQLTPLLKALAFMSFQAKEYDAAVDYGTRLTRSNAGDPEVFTVIGQSYYQKGDYAEAARFFKSLVNEQVKRGQTPLEPNLVMMQSAYEKLKDKAGATDTLELLVVYYPKPTYWESLLFSVRGMASLQQRQRLFVFRLMWATNTLKLRQDFDLFAQFALGAHLDAEAQKVYEAGIKAGIYVDSDKLRAERLMKSAGATAAGERANLPAREAAAAAAPTGEPSVLLGMSLYSYGEFDKAIPALQRGFAKGGLPPDRQVEAGLMLGIAQLRTKDKPGAQKTFAGIKTSDPGWQRIVKLWGLYAK